MPCYKDLAHCALPSGQVRGSTLIRQRNASSVPDLRAMDPAFVAGTAKQASMQHAEVLRLSAERHILRCGVQPRLQAHHHMEESRWHRRLHPSLPPPCSLTVGGRGSSQFDVTLPPVSSR
mmetsp:Transcript_79454/g.207192  ORF Transcript_79454/g.207192 Transcript_79454/m.207192 type:complete len:120 (-) Transcript_79454:70-429(-)|eukprot:CAMPEP_0183417188 /NCGR_PEP_ID=MMETSP0370-20130417/24265_1 /TAXON_ID=268820 /ORGANISM="Peridinium aciculiferum, Strain PAER-2" /LENGTH=119 /DNA_ID=CAMNT_0025600753 /DNA_START=77 /DNA_END=432 /DNA_ORIENTATION=-